MKDKSLIWVDGRFDAEGGPWSWRLRLFRRGEDKCFAFMESVDQYDLRWKAVAAAKGVAAMMGAEYVERAAGGEREC